jgi:hypothetical protein
MRAHAVGPDLSRYIVKLQRVEDLRDADAPAPDDVEPEADEVDEAHTLPISA